MIQPWCGSGWRSPERREAVGGALERLERSALHPETVPIHDALYHLRAAMVEGDLCAALEQLAALRDLLDGSRHPDRLQLIELISSFDGTDLELAAPREPTATEALEALGIAVIDGDVPAAIRRFVARELDLRRVLEQRLEELERRYRRVAITSNVLSVVSAVLAGLLLATGAVALDLIEIRWMEPPSWDEQPPAPVAGTDRGSVR